MGRQQLQKESSWDGEEVATAQTNIALLSELLMSERPPHWLRSSLNAHSVTCEIGAAAP